jgi:hypothetical protein
MLRLARLDSTGIFHHVRGRGIERKEIFFCDENRDDFVGQLAAQVEQGELDNYAWALLPNQIVERLRFLSQMRSHAQILKFNVGDRITFQPEDMAAIFGILTRYNKKTVTVIIASVWQERK